jgi:hypothetical protein
MQFTECWPKLKSELPFFDFKIELLHFALFIEQFIGRAALVEDLQRDDG